MEDQNRKQVTLWEAAEYLDLTPGDVQDMVERAVQEAGGPALELFRGGALLETGHRQVLQQLFGLRRAQGIRERLGGSADMTKLFPEKPKGMHWETYERLWWEQHEAEMEHLAGMRGWLDKLERKLS